LSLAIVNSQSSVAIYLRLWSHLNRMFLVTQWHLAAVTL